MSLVFVFQGGAGALDPGQVRAAPVPGLAAVLRPVPGPAAGEGDGRGRPAGHRPAAGPRLPAAGQRDVRGRLQRPAPGRTQGTRGDRPAARLGKPSWREGGGRGLCKVSS